MATALKASRPLSNLLVAGGSRVFTSLAAVLVSLSLARLTTTRDFVAFGVITTAMPLITSLLTVGFSQSVMRLLHPSVRDQYGSRRSIITLSLSVTGIAVGIAILLAMLLPAQELFGYRASTPELYGLFILLVIAPFQRLLGEIARSQNAIALSVSFGFFGLYGGGAQTFIFLAVVACMVLTQGQLSLVDLLAIQAATSLISIFAMAGYLVARLKETGETAQLNLGTVARLCGSNLASGLLTDIRGQVLLWIGLATLRL